MQKINLLDCTLRDGGYINDWHFGENAIKGMVKKLSQTGIEMIEIGFLRGTEYDSDRSLFPDTDSCKNILGEKNPNVTYVVMLDMSKPVPLDSVTPRDGSSVDGIRVIFKKSKIDEAYEYCRHVKNMGYMLFVNFVNTDQYSDKEFIDGLEHFSELNPDAVTVVDTFGAIKKKEFSRMIMIADNNLPKNIMLCYHGHNNLQQAFENAQMMTEMNLSRNISIDACVFGMGRGAGNLNLELFAEYLNENYGKNYRLPPMLEIMDEYLNDVYQNKFWGYSLPLYLSAIHRCHPNYALYLAEKNTLPVKAFDELLKMIPQDKRVIFDKNIAEFYYLNYMKNYVDDKDVLSELAEKFRDRNVFMLAPGKSISMHYELIKREIQNSNAVSVSVNFFNKIIRSEYIFCGNIRRFMALPENTGAKIIVTSNIDKNAGADYTVNFASYISDNDETLDNAALMCLRLLYKIGVRKVKIAGMDGYTNYNKYDFFEEANENDSSNEKKETRYFASEIKNKMISNELNKLNKIMNLEIITPTHYKLN